MCSAVERPGSKIDWPTRDRSFARIVPWSSGRVRRLWRVVSGSCGAIIGDLDCSKQMPAYLQFTKAAQLLRNIPDAMGTNSSSHMASTQPPTYSTPRRSQRIWLTMPIHVSFEISDRLRRAEETSTLLVNAHGALILLSTEVTVGQRLTLANIRTAQKRECRQVMIGFRTSNMNEVGVELLEPFDGFWRALNPPRDWAQFREAWKQNVVTCGAKLQG